MNTVHTERAPADSDAAKLFRIKILTAKLFAVKILQACFCEVDCFQDFSRGRGRGVPFKICSPRTDGRLTSRGGVRHLMSEA